MVMCRRIAEMGARMEVSVLSEITLLLLMPYQTTCKANLATVLHGRWLASVIGWFMGNLSVIH